MSARLLGTPSPTLCRVRLHVKVEPPPGLTNQLQYLCSGIITGFGRGFRSFGVDLFLACVGRRTLCPASRLLDLPRTAESFSATLGQQITLQDLPPGPSQTFPPSLSPPAGQNDLFLSLLRGLVFNPALSRAADELRERHGIPPLPDILHLRMEEDACRWWGKRAGMGKADFIACLEGKYLRALAAFPSERPVYVLSGDPALARALLAKAGRRGFCLEAREKEAATKAAVGCQGREMSAVLEYLIVTGGPAEQSPESFFIGVGGSTFTRFLQLNSPRAKKGFINLDNLKAEVLFV